MYHRRCRQWKCNVYIYGWLISVLLCETLGGISWVKRTSIFKEARNYCRVGCVKSWGFQNVIM